ncbi:hypothetical protein [Mycobacteroides abscessus]|nr:hypothetical protein [Mycobacteroides abscessus]
MAPRPAGPDECPGDITWRRLDGPEPDLATEISNCIAESDLPLDNCLQALRQSLSLLMFSDYGGAHKGARFDVMSFLVTTPEGLSRFSSGRDRLRQGQLGTERRMSYKALGDKVRLRALPAYLEVADQLTGLLVSFAVDKAGSYRLSEEYQAETAFGPLSPWTPRAFRKLTTIGHLAAIVIEGLRRDGQNLIWITDEDEIAANLKKHTEATKVLGHYFNLYCTGPMGHIRFGTTASDSGDLYIEDLAAVPDLAAGCLNELLTEIFPHPQSSSVSRLFIPPGATGIPVKAGVVTEWLAGSAQPLLKVNVVVHEKASLCSVRRLVVVTRLEDL